MRTAPPAATVARSGPRDRWLVDAVISGFVATGVSTVALVVAYLAANAAGTADGDVFRVWLWGLTHNEVVSFSQASAPAALALHVLFGLAWAVLYARLFEYRVAGPGWRVGMLFAVIPWLLSLVVFLPVVGAGVFGGDLNAGPLPAAGNLVLHLIYGFVLGQLYDASADAPAIAEDLTYDEPLEREAVAHSEAFSAAGIVGGIIVGALVGAGVGMVLPPGVRESSTGWSLALAIGGMLAGGGIGAIVGSFAGLPSAQRDPAEHSMGPDPFERTVLPFLLVPALVLVVVGIIVGLGSLLLSIAAMEAAANPQERAKLWPVYAALVATALIGVGAWVLSLRQESRSRGETVSHGGR